MALFEHTITSGQSLSVGAQYEPQQDGFSTVTEAANAKTMTVVSGALADHQVIAGQRQRPDLSMGYRIAQANPAKIMGFSTHGAGGAKIAELSKGTVQYDNAINTVTGAKNSRVAAGDTYKIRAFHWIQGESDQRTTTMTVAAYRAALLALRADYDTDLKAITGQADVIPWILSQPGTWPESAIPPTVPLALLDVARTVPGCYLMGGQYQLEYRDILHPSARGYYHLGELHARAHNAVLAGTGWAPFAPIAYEVLPYSIVITYNVPSGSLAEDTTTVAAQPNLGFSLTGTSAQITGAAVTATNKVTLTTDRTVTEAAAAVGYGVTAGATSLGLGNLRDSDPGVSVYDATPLRNWAAQSLDVLGLAGPPIPSLLFEVSAMYGKQGGVFYQLNV